jgi:ribonuclease E
MRITLSGAMRARDVSRPTDEQLAAAAEREARTARAVRPGSASTPRGPGSGAPGTAALAAAAPGAAAVDERAPGAVAEAAAGAVAEAAAGAVAEAAAGAVAEAAPGAVAKAAQAAAARAAADGSTVSSATSARTARPPARSADGTGENGPAAGERAAGEPTADEAPSPTRRRRRRRGR